MGWAPRWAACALWMIFAGCRTASSPSAAPTATATEALAAFIEAANAGDFDRAYALLSGDWRARYTPERLRSDFEAEPLAKERLERARVASAQAPVVRGDVAEFPIGAGKAVRLVKENGNFRVAALE